MALHTWEFTTLARLTLAFHQLALPRQAEALNISNHRGLLKYSSRQFCAQSEQVQLKALICNQK